MKRYNILFGSGAKEEIEAIYNWYELQKEGLGLEFLSELESIVEIIGDNPFTFKKAYLHFQRAVLFRFPYLIYHEVIEQNSEAEILVVIHSSQNPKTATKRLKNKKK